MAVAQKTVNLVKMIEDKAKGKITGTTFEYGAKIGENELNFHIGNAIRTLKDTHATISDVEIHLPDIDIEEKGFLFRSEDGEAFILWNPDKVKISEVMLAKHPDEYPNSFFLQMVVLLDSVVKLSNPDSPMLLDTIVREKMIDDTNPIAKVFSDYVFELEKAIESEVFSFDTISDDEYTVEEETLLFPVFAVVEKEEKTKVTEIKSLAEELLISITPEVTVEPVKVIETKPKEEVEQLTLLSMEEIPVVTAKKTKSKKQSTQGSANLDDLKDMFAEVLYELLEIKKTNEKPKEIILEVEEITLEDVKVRRPDIFDFTAKEEKLNEFKLERKFKRSVLKFAKKQLELLTPKQMMLIPDKMKYKGYTQPIEIGIGSLLTSNNLIVKGETGTGKTTLVKTIAALLNYPMYIANGSRDASIETFIGFKELQDGNITVKEGPCTNAMVNGALFYIDEGNAVLPGVLIMMHSAFDDERILSNEMTGEVVHAHPHFRFVTSINEEYEGTLDMNDATMDRVVAIEMTYMKPSNLGDLLAIFDGQYTEFQKEELNMTEVSEKDISILVSIAEALQEAVKDENLELSPKIASIRNILALLKMTRMMSFEKALPAIFTKYNKDERVAILSVLKRVPFLNINPVEMLKYY